MALWLTVVIALTCLGGLASPGPHSRRELKELIEELVNITQNQVSTLVLGWVTLRQGNWSLFRP